MGLAMFLRCTALLFALISQECQGSSPPLRACPQEQPDARRSKRADDGDATLKASFTNDAGIDLALFWYNSEGGEVFLENLPRGQKVDQDCFAGHVFHVRSQKTKKLVDRFEVNDGAVNFVSIACAGMEVEVEDELDRSRWPEFEQLAADLAETTCEGPSSEWSCARHVGPEEVKARDSSLYGFTAEEAATTGNPYRAGTTIDHIFASQMKYMPNVTAYEGGYLRMRMTKKMMELLPYYRENQNKKYKSSIVPGFFTNNHIVHMDMVGVGGALKQQIVNEMHQVLEWWTKKRLIHKTTFGIRVYRRGAMLINHLDRKDTHLASAILQVNQTCDTNAGWPVEVIHPHRAGLTEVYLQPGEMLLYEGARLNHGRPMRFQGEEFANLFSHFAPADFRLDESWRNPHLFAKDRVEL